MAENRQSERAAAKNAKSGEPLCHACYDSRADLAAAGEPAVTVKCPRSDEEMCYECAKSCVARTGYLCMFGEEARGCCSQCGDDAGSVEPIYSLPALS